MKGKWEAECDEILYMLDGEFTGIVLLPPNPDDDFDDEYQMVIGRPDDERARYFLNGSRRAVKHEAGGIADEFIAEHGVLA